jgi:hypothetical protein
MNTIIVNIEKRTEPKLNECRSFSDIPQVGHVVMVGDARLRVIGVEWAEEELVVLGRQLMRPTIIVTETS